MRLWMASGMAACAVYKAMAIGKMRGRKYVSEEQVRQAQADIIDRLAESEVRVKHQARDLDREQLQNFPTHCIQGLFRPKD